MNTVRNEELEVRSFFMRLRALYFKTHTADGSRKQHTS